LDLKNSEKMMRKDVSGGGFKIIRRFKRWRGPSSRNPKK
jgi:hypothetical protein